MEKERIQETKAQLKEKFDECARKMHELAKEFHTTENYYFYDAGTGKVIQCSKTIYEIIKIWRETGKYETAYECGLSEENILKELRELWRIMQEEHILQAVTIERFFVPKDMEHFISGNVEMLILELTERCNLRCKYCIYQNTNKNYRTYGEKDMSFDTAKKAIDFLVSHSFAVDRNTKLKLTFYGGEPLLKFDLMKKCVNYAKKCASDRKWIFSMTSNLTLLTDEMCKWFAENKFSVTVSLDGDRETHDSQRVFPNGKGSFDIVMKNLKRLVLSYDNQDRTLISINSVITPPYDEEKLNRMQDFFASFDWISEQTHHTWTYAQYGVSHSMEELQYMLIRNETANADELDPITQWHYEKTLLNPKQSLFTGKDEMRSLLDIQERRIIDEPSRIVSLNACCVPGVRRIYATVDGKFKVCERIGYSPDIGNVDTGLDYSIIKKYYIDEYIEKSMSDCQHCWAVNLCSVCYAYCFDEQGLNINAKVVVCSKARFLKEQALIHYHELLERDSEYLRRVLELPN